jgi:ribonuclease R
MAQTKEDRFQEKLKTEIVEFFELNNDRSLSLNQLIKAFAIRDRDRKVLVGHLLEKLTKDRKLIKHANGQYQIDASDSVLVGVVDHVNPRFAFVRVAERDDDIYVETNNLHGAIDGDTVQLHTWAGGKRSKNMEGEVMKIVQRRPDEIVGTIQRSAMHSFVIPDSKKLFADVFIPRGFEAEAPDGHKVILKVLNWAHGGRKMEGKVIEVLGPAGDNNAEMHAILAEFGLPYHFDPAIDAEANSIPTSLPAAEIKRRRDFRKTLTITIDPADAKDFDDALSIQYLKNGNTEIGVHIADVTHYVKPGSKLEAEALKRATSVYLVDRTVPMLPEKLSNNLCSLRPHEDKFTFSAVFELDAEANIINEWFGRTVIHSARRFSYEQAQDVLNGNSPELHQELNLMNNLAKKLRKKRFEEGSVNFETVEVKFELDPTGKPMGVKPKVRVDAHKLIEEYMLLANKRVAEYVFNLKKEEPKNTMVYRVHEPPNLDKLATFAKFAAKFGYTVNPNQVAKTLNNLMESVEGKPEQNIMESLAVRTMAKARYSTQPIGHFGLAFPFYSHFTSPIRRYPDMLAHRLLQHYLDGGSPADAAELELQCRHSSDRERLANEAERASIKYKQVEYMSLQPERDYVGIISGVTDFGLFVEIPETTAEGLVRMIDLTADYFEYDPENYRLVGRATGKIYTFGDQVSVRVKEYNISKRSLDLTLLNQGNNNRSRAIYHKMNREAFGSGARVPSKIKSKNQHRRRR